MEIRNRIDWIFFDLDGTMTDSEPGMAESFAYIFDKYGIPYTPGDLRVLYGPPIALSLGVYFDAGDVDMAVEEYREHYTEERMLNGNSLFAGIPELLRGLRAGGYGLAVVTGKPQGMAEAVVEHFGIRGYFDAVYGARNRYSEKVETLQHALKAHACLPERAIMIGDRLHDLEAAAMAGTGGIGVLWGYAAPGELSEREHLLLADTPGDIAEFFGVA